MVYPPATGGQMASTSPACSLPGRSRSSWQTNTPFSSTRCADSRGTLNWSMTVFRLAWSATSTSVALRCAWAGSRPLRLAYSFRVMFMRQGPCWGTCCARYASMMRVGSSISLCFHLPSRVWFWIRPRSTPTCWVSPKAFAPTSRSSSN